MEFQGFLISTFLFFFADAKLQKVGNGGGENAEIRSVV